MKLRIILGVAIFFVALPLQADAEVIFSEIAWMGTTESANNEWIEIYNFSSNPTDINGWTLSDGGSLNIELVGVMSPHGVFVLERTDDTSAPGVTASQVYTGALTNSGATLTIRDAGGNIEGEPLVGGENWENIGGNNESKYTAQSTRTGQWVTGPPTPGLPNVEEEDLPPENNNDDDDDNEVESEESNGDGGGSTLEKRLLKSFSAGGGRIVSVGAAEFFEAQAYDQSENTLSSIHYSWNFGNGIVYEGRKVLHQYDYPGSYVVTARAEAPDGTTQSEQFTVEAKLAEVVVSSVTSEYVALTNKASRDIDLSTWTLRSGEQVFQIPNDTILLSGKTLMFPSGAIGLQTAGIGDVALLYPSGHTAYRYASIKPKTTVASVVPRTAVATLGQPEKSEALAPENKEVVETSALPAAVGSAVKGASLLPWLLGLFALLLAAIGGLLVVRTKEEPLSEAGMYTIIDESEEE